jgi:hypothetical protein
MLIHYVADLSFIIYTTFTRAVKVEDTMKPSFGAYSKEFELINRSLKRVPAIARCIYLHDKIHGFFILLVFHDTTQTTLDVTVLSTAYPSNIRELVVSQSQESNYPVIVAPYVSKESAAVCAHHNIGYFDRSGNCRLALHCLYVSDQGHLNKFPERRGTKTIFAPSSRVSSHILREIMSNIGYRWKLSHLAAKLNCSVGQVFKVKDYLWEQRWAQMTKSGLRITEPEAIMRSWSEEYSQRSSSFDVMHCYTLLPIPEFEDKVRAITKNSGFLGWQILFSCQVLDPRFQLHGVAGNHRRISM